MDSVIIVAAKYLIYVMVLGFAAVWLFAEKRRGKVELAVAAVVGLVIVLVLIKIASASYSDPRPFVVDPSITPLIPHDPDNGFPSDHSSAAGLIALLVLIRHRLIGAVFVLAAIGVAWGRVAAQVHHLLDVATGLGIGAVAAVLGILCMTVLLRSTPLLRWSPIRRFVEGPAESGPAPAGPTGTGPAGTGPAGTGPGDDSAGRHRSRE